MAKSKHAQKRQVTPWDRWKVWVSKNEKVLWVGLLILIAPLMAFTFPVTSFFATRDDVLARAYGEDIRRSDLEEFNRMVSAVQRVAPGVLSGLQPLIGGSNRRDYDPFGFFVFKAKARRMGIRVSDEELGETIREIWRASEAMRLAQEEIASQPPDPNQNPQLQIYLKQQEKARQLRESGAFDAEGWKAAIAKTKVAVFKFEDMLRDVFTLRKLQAYVQSTVKISDEQVYEEFRKGEQERRLSWVSWEPTDELEAAIAAGVTNDDVREYFQRNRREFFEPVAVKPSYLLVPEEHFRKEVEQSVEREQLEEYYEENRNDYRKPAILAEDGVFALRSAAEQAAIDVQLFKPLAEVEADVREKYIEREARRRLSEVAREIRQKLFPAASAGQEPATVADLRKEYPFVEVGTTGFATEDDAEEVLGEVWSRDVNRWFRELAGGRGRTAASSVQPPRWDQAVDKGRLFYTQLEVRPASQPGLTSVEDEVKDAVVLEKALEAVRNALDEALGDLEGDAAIQKIAQLVADGVEVEVGDTTVKLKPTATSFAGALEPAGRYGVIRVASEKEDEDASTPDEDGASEEGEPHPSSRTILDAGFTVAEVGEAATAFDKRESTCYLVRLDEIVWPDPADFEDRKKTYEGQLMRQERQIYFAEWRRQVLLEAEGADAEALAAVDDGGTEPAEGSVPESPAR